MRSDFIARTRKWIGASALAILVGIGGGTAFLAASSPMAVAQVTPQIIPTAQVQVAPVQAPGFADLVDAVKPAVVSITVEGRAAPANSITLNGQDFNGQIPDLPDDNFLKKFFDQFGNGQDGNGPQQGRPQQGRKFMAAGSGFVISADGYVVTNNHVVENATKVTVNFENGDQRTATVVGTDERTDLAVVKVDGVSDLPFVKFAETPARVGDWVIAVGNPFGLGGTVTAGIVSALGRDVPQSTYGDFLQIDAAINMGNSGGPTFNMAGEVVGVNTEIFSPNGGNVGIAFDIPAKTVQRITAELIKSGSVTRGFLGVNIQDVTRDIADSVGLANAKGALVTQLTEDSPGGKAGLQSGDIITGVNGEEIDNARGLSRTIASNPPGATVELNVLRAGKQITLTATLGTLKDDSGKAPADKQGQPDSPDHGPMQTDVGLTLVPNSGGEGLLVQDVDPESVAADKGFAVGDQILEVDNKKVTTGKQFEDAIKGVKDAGRGTALIKAARDGNVMFIGLPLSK